MSIQVNNQKTMFDSAEIKKKTINYTHKSVNFMAFLLYLNKSVKVLIETL